MKPATKKPPQPVFPPPTPLLDDSGEGHEDSDDNASLFSQQPRSENSTSWSAITKQKQLRLKASVGKMIPTYKQVNSSLTINVMPQIDWQGCIRRTYLWHYTSVRPGVIANSAGGVVASSEKSQCLKLALIWFDGWASFN